MHLHPSPRQRDLMDTAYELAMTRFAKRTAEIRQQARAGHIMVQRNAVAVGQEAMRICGGRALLKQFPFERYARDAHASSVMRPWTQEAVIEDSWRNILAAESETVKREA